MSHPLNAKERDKLLRSTKEAAAAFAEDMDHIRDIASRVIPDAAELRRASGHLRRLLIDNNGDLRKIAACRIGKFSLKALDNAPYYREEGPQSYLLFASGLIGAPSGLPFRGIVFNRPGEYRNIEKDESGNLIDLNLDGFLAQRIFCIHGKWITRRETIRYVAHVGSGVHSGTANDTDEVAISRIRNCVTIKMLPGNLPSVGFLPQESLIVSPEFIHRPDSIDPVLNEIAITCYFMSISPDLRELEKVVRSELQFPVRMP
jgi:hypothetical protein